MADHRSIDSAPHDGSKVTVVWTDSRGQVSHSLAQYRSLERMKATGGDWDTSDEGWWAFVDGDTQKRIQPDSWVPGKL